MSCRPLDEYGASLIIKNLQPLWGQCGKKLCKFFPDPALLRKLALPAQTAGV
jgi:hypothetical protein